MAIKLPRGFQNVFPDFDLDKQDKHPNAVVYLEPRDVGLNNFPQAAAMAIKVAKKNPDNYVVLNFAESQGINVRDYDTLATLEDERVIREVEYWKTPAGIERQERANAAKAESSRPTSSLGDTGDLETLCKSRQRKIT